MGLRIDNWRKLWFSRQADGKTDDKEALSSLQNALSTTEPEKSDVPTEPNSEKNNLFASLKLDPPKNSQNPSLTPIERWANIINQRHNLSAERLREQVTSLLASIKVVAFVGPSGTGKSTRAIEVANQNNIDYFIDDGLLIHGSRILCGTSAKRALTRLQSVRQAIFLDQTQAENMRRALAQHNPPVLMILGTSDAMLDKICTNLWLNKPSRYIRIEDFTTAEERYQAKQTRLRAGQHTIPVPSMEIKHEFNGYFSASLNKIKRRWDRGRDGGRELLPMMEENAKTVVRPTFSGLGSYSISDEAIHSMAMIILRKVAGVAEVSAFHLQKEPYGIVLKLEISLQYGYNAQNTMREIQVILASEIEKLTSINVMTVHVKATRVVKPKKTYITAPKDDGSKLKEERYNA